jgi:hypothetical protein
MEEVRPEDVETYRRLARVFGGQLRRRVKVTCQVCGKEIESTLRQGQPYRRYCSPACSVKAYRHRHHDEVLRRKREAYRRKKGGQQQPDSN